MAQCAKSVTEGEWEMFIKVQLQRSDSRKTTHRREDFNHLNKPDTSGFTSPTSCENLHLSSDLQFEIITLLCDNLNPKTSDWHKHQCAAFLPAFHLKSSFCRLLFPPLTSVPSRWKLGSFFLLIYTQLRLLVSLWPRTSVHPVFLLQELFLFGLFYLEDAS